MDTSLPIFSVVPEIKRALSENNTAILQAAPGAGKSTVLPLLLMDEAWLGNKKIIMLEPRRLAAKAIAWRLAEQIAEEPGNTIGYRVRFETRCGKNTKLEVVTEGILTRMLQSDNSLEDTGLVIFDEFHERNLQADLALAICKESQQVLRNDMRILVMSATLNISNLSEYLGNAPVIRSEGRQYPVKKIYIEPDANISLSQNTSRVVLKAIREEHGDILVFLPGSADIHRVEKMLEDSGENILVCPLYGDLPHKQQQSALLPDPKGKRKVILSTAIAETSLTIEGIRIVVDSGYSRLAKYDPKTGMTKLETLRSSLDTSEQRAGRAGRLSEGICYRIWNQSSEIHLPLHRQAEILQADLSSLMLELANWGHADPSTLSWLTPPPLSAIRDATTLLESLDAIKEGKISEVGKKLLAIPAHPRIAHLLLAGIEMGFASLAADIAAILEERDPLARDSGTDIFLRLQALENMRSKKKFNAERKNLERIDQVARHWKSLLHISSDKNTADHFTAGKLISLAYPGRIAKRENTANKYRLANGRSASLPEHDPLCNEEWIAIAHLDAGNKEGKIFLASAFDPAELISQSSPHEILEWNEREGSINARREWRIGNLVAEKKSINKIDQEKILPLLCDVIRREGLTLFDWTNTAEQFRARVLSVNVWQPEAGLPDLSDAYLLDHPEEWASPFLDKIKKREDFKKLDLKVMLNALLSHHQSQILTRYAPEKISVPSGSEISLTYSPDGSMPVLAVRLQEVFGLTDTPTVNEGRTPVLMHLLSPGYKPVQVTRDLRSFWTNTYQAVRKELRIRYQKHSWPEDPFTAVPVKGAKKRDR